MLKLFLGNIGIQSAQYVAISVVQLGLFSLGRKIIKTMPPNEKTTTDACTLQQQDLKL